MNPRRTLPVRGFTLIEILVVIGMIAVLASIVLVAINPLRQFAQARNAQRESDVNAILNAIGEHLADSRGEFTTSNCTLAFPTEETNISTGMFDVRGCIVPAYLSEMPVDPTRGTNTCTDQNCAEGQYDTGYTAVQDQNTGRITICAPGAAEAAIPDSSAYCLTR